MANPLAGVDDFFDTYWEQTFLHLRAQIVDVPVSFADVDHLLADHLLTTSTVLMSVGGDLIDNDRFTVDSTSLVARGIGPQSVVDPDRLLGEFQRGATASFQRIDDFLPAAATLAAELTELVGHPVRGNVYLTPPGSPGLGIHIDGADVFVIQCAGVKRWELWKREVPRPLFEDVWTPTVLPEPDYVVDLEPGDLLYLPRGWRHRVGAGAETSLSASFNIRTVTRAHIARAAVERVVQTDAFRLALDPESMRSSDACAEELKHVLAELAHDIAKMDPADFVADVGELVHQVRQPKPTATVAEAIAAIGLTDGHRLVLAPDVSASAKDGTLRRGAELVTPPPQFMSALSRLDEPATVSEIRGGLPIKAAEPLLLRLVADGWLETI